MTDSNVYISQLEGSDILRLKLESTDSNSKSISLNDLHRKYKGSIPDSLGIRYLKSEYPDRFNYEEAVQKTNCIIDVKFKFDLREIIEDAVYVRKSNRKKNKIYKADKRFGDTIKTKLQVRQELYQNGFTLDGILYKFLCRTSSKARIGQALFMDESLIDDFRNWCRMELKFEDDEICDNASLMAYEALALSGIIGIVNIQPGEILLIADFKSHFTEKASITEYNSELNRLVVQERMIEQTSDIFDGQSLLDVSKFTDDFEGKGCLLVREKFFKSCAFNTNIQQFFKDNGIIEVTDMFGHKHDATKIKLITTPNSLKVLKLSYKMPSKNPEDMYKHWLKHIDFNFGIVKSEKESPYEDGYNRLSYQMINSLPLIKQEIKELAEYNINQINSINNDIEYFREFLKARGEIDLTADMFSNLIRANSDIQYTPMYINKRKNEVDRLKDYMRQGHLLIKADYSILVSNPIEMLKSAAGIEWIESLHNPYEIHSTMFEDGEDIVGFRNPHVCAGNVCMFKVRKLLEIDKYMNLTKNIVVINSYKTDTLSRLQGADMDSDCVLLTNISCILKAAQQCKSFVTPLNQIQGEPTQYNKYNPVDQANIDHIISDNLIGQTINLSQLFNSYYWHYKKNGGTDEQLQTIYDQVSKLSSISQCEIDKAKKYYELDVSRQLNKIVATVFDEFSLSDLKEDKARKLAKVRHIKEKIDSIPYLKFGWNNLYLLSNMSECQGIGFVSHEHEINRLRQFFPDEANCYKNDIEFLQSDRVKSDIERQLNRLERRMERHYNLEKLSEELRQFEAEIESRKLEIDQYISDNTIVKHTDIKRNRKLLSGDMAEKQKDYDEKLALGELSEQEYNELTNLLWTDERKKRKQIRPLFFKYNSKDQECKFQKFDCPMDYLIEVIDEIKKAPRSIKKLTIAQLVDPENVFDKTKADRGRVKNIEEIAKQTKVEIDDLKMVFGVGEDNDLSYESYQLYKLNKQNVIDEAVKKVRNIKINNINTMLTLIFRCYAVDNKHIYKEELSDCRSLLLGLLYKAHTRLFMECFRKR
jgi:hypothetical protein